MTVDAGYAARCARAAAALRAPGAAPRLAKRTSNLFRDRRRASGRRLDLSDFDHVLGFGEGWVDAEGLVTYERLVEATLARGLMPKVVPQLKTITVGGAVAGVGIEATSFRHGLVHDTLIEADVLLADGEIVTCRPDNEHRPLFLGLPNSYGTLGYALRLRLATQPVREFVRVEHRRLAAADAFFAALREACDGDADFVDAVVFDRGTLVLSVGRFVDSAPWASDYGFERIYYRSLLEREVDHLRTADYLWRWDTDWFWCSKNVGAQHPLLRRLYGPERLNSRTYQRLMRFNARWGFTRAWSRLRGLHTESVIQDVDLPFDAAEGFLDFLLARIGIVPVWVCPIRAPDPERPFTLYPLRSDTRCVNFGFWDVVATREAHPAGHFNRLVERELLARGGIKSLYSESWFTPEEFARAYDGERYAALKARYDPAGRLLGLYEKCVRRA